jgi:hypothetical protein
MHQIVLLIPVILVPNESVSRLKTACIFTCDINAETSEGLGNYNQRSSSAGTHTESRLNKYSQCIVRLT